jgi:hypothetical protein
LLLLTLTCLLLLLRFQAAGAGDEVIVAVIPRSREVGQSYFTSVFTTLKSLLYAMFTVLKHKPGLVSE